MNNQRTLTYLKIVIFLALTLAACSGAPQSQDAQHYVGAVDGSDAFIGLVSDGINIRAYVCDGTTDSVNISAWFQGDVSDGSFALASEGGLSLTGQITESGVDGTVGFVDSTQHSFSATSATEPAGLYRLEETVDGNTTVSGWIILPNGEYRGGLSLTNLVGGPPAIIGGPPAIQFRLLFP
ncbi:MAG TPA: hypothetical protein VFQ23_21290 [Anaerolineales bacterium]|nr:hypothetical protein [Anaerolineales bacterium]